jgi:hypothetical protein
MTHTMKQTVKSTAKSLLKKGKALLHHDPVFPVERETAVDKAFRTGQENLDAAARAVHEATNQKGLDKAKRHLVIVQKAFDVVFKAHQKKAEKTAGHDAEL